MVIHRQSTIASYTPVGNRRVIAFRMGTHIPLELRRQVYEGVEGCCEFCPVRPGLHAAFAHLIQPTFTAVV